MESPSNVECLFPRHDLCCLFLVGVEGKGLVDDVSVLCIDNVRSHDLQDMELVVAETEQLHHAGALVAGVEAP